MNRRPKRRLVPLQPTMRIKSPLDVDMRLASNAKVYAQRAISAFYILPRTALHAAHPLPAHDRG